MPSEAESGQFDLHGPLTRFEHSTATVRRDRAAMQSISQFNEAAGAGCQPYLPIAEALQDGHIYAAFQPKVSLQTGALTGVEALARWKCPTLGHISPEVFIPMAEQQGVIAELSALILKQALAACVELRRHSPHISMAVNIAPSLLSDISMPSQIDRALSLAGLPASALVAEITESQVIGDIAGAAVCLKALRARGIQCAIDDFGTGHSSLLSLLRLPFSELKIDRAFVTNCANDRDAETIIRATLGMAHEMGMHVVAEGIETRGAEAMLKALGCVTGQGFRYGRAMPSSAIIARFSRQQSMVTV
jgi:EAL domain-containing protein (putative c-di-GMP-specific phosphodiesterase class I)